MNNNVPDKISEILTHKRIISLCLFILALVIRAYQFYKSGSGFFPDSTQYLSMASNLIDHNKLVSFGALFPDIMRPIFYPLTVSAFYIITKNILLSGVAVSIIAGAISIVAIYYIACELFDPAVASVAGILAAVNPTLMAVSTYCLTDALALCFLLFAYLFGFKMITTERYLFAILSAVFFALGFLTRQIVEIHAYSFLFFISLTMLFRKKITSLIKLVSVLLCTTIIAIAPYLYFTYKKTGHVVLNTGKDYFGVQNAVLQHKMNDGFYDKITQNYFNMSETFKNLLDSEIEFRALNDNNERLLSFDYYYRVFEPIRTNNTGSSILEKGKKIIFNARELLALLWSSHGLLILFLLAGLFFMIKDRAFALFFIIFSISADVTLILLEHQEDRYAINILAFLSIIIAYGLVTTINVWKSKVSSNVSNKIGNISLVVILLLSLILNVRIYSRTMNKIKAENEKLTKVVTRIEEYVKPGSFIAARYPTYIFLLKGEYVPLPMAEFENTMEYLMNKKVEYLIISPDALQLRPYLSVEKLNHESKFKLLKEVKVNNENWYIYKNCLLSQAQL